MDDVLNWVSGPDGAGFYVGKLNGQPITGVAMIQHNKSYAWVGLYFCEEEHRGKGYAFKTWKVARASLNPEINVGLGAVVSAASLYEREGLDSKELGSRLSTTSLFHPFLKHTRI